jgi:hypothetical protein
MKAGVNSKFNSLCTLRYIAYMIPAFIMRIVIKELPAISIASFDISILRGHNNIAKPVEYPEDYLVPLFGNTHHTLLQLKSVLPQFPIDADKSRNYRKAQPDMNANRNLVF